MAGYLVDENVIFDFFNGKTELFNLFDETENIYVNVISIAKLYERASKLSGVDDAVQSCKDFCSQLNQINIDERIAFEYSRLRKLAEENNLKLDDDKIWLSACAVLWNLTVVTDDKEIEKLSGVRIFYPE